MQINNSDLLKGEHIIKEKMANLIIVPKDFNLKKFAFDKMMWTVGMKDKEALGGKLYLTNYRLLFKSHAVNRLTGTVSIFLPTIKMVKNSSYFVTRKITVQTLHAKVDFVIWGIKEFINKINAQQALLSHEQVETIRQLVKEDPAQVIYGLKNQEALNFINDLFLAKEEITGGLEILNNPLGAITTMLLEELFSGTVAESWQENFNR
jgi:hypothetical protein